MKEKWKGTKDLLFPLIKTAQVPVGVFSSSRYSTLTPSLVAASRNFPFF